MEESSGLKKEDNWLKERGCMEKNRRDENAQLKEKKIEKLQEGKSIHVTVPGSKSITNRALLLAALSSKTCRLSGVLFSDDSRAFLDCLIKLGFNIQINEAQKEVTVEGTGGRIPNNGATIYVASAGTAARFLTVMLAFSGGEYELTASEQMCRRPMEPLLSLLSSYGVQFEYHEEKGHFPFRMRAPQLSMKEVRIDTGVSSQFASALLMCGHMLQDGLTVELLGDRRGGSYIQMTLAMMQQFGIAVQREGNLCMVPGHAHPYGLASYEIEPDVSAACYFYAMAPLLKTDVIVKGVHEPSLQGDVKFLGALRQMGCVKSDTSDGICLDGRKLESYPGLSLSMKDFSDQTMTMAAIAPFASTRTVITGIGHIRFQESDRLHAILTELSRMGVSCGEIAEGDGIWIDPIDSEEIPETSVETYEDHRMAMAFSLIGCKTGKITILNPCCCRKTFETFFDVLETCQES